MNDLIPFLFDDAILIRAGRSASGEPLLVGADVCRALGIKKHEAALARLDFDQKGSLAVGTPGGLQTMIGVTEPGFYCLVSTSRKPDAKRMMRWVFHEVLPAIRKTGRYDALARDPKAAKTDLAKRRADAMAMNAASRALAVIGRAGGPRAMTANAPAIYAGVGLDIDMSTSNAFDQGNLHLVVDNEEKPK